MVVTKELPGERWLDILTKAGCRVEVSQFEGTITDNASVKKLIGDKCHGVLGQLTEVTATPQVPNAAGNPLLSLFARCRRPCL